jgi:hypothetical protein
MPGARFFVHADGLPITVSILRSRCTEPWAGAREKLSTVSVDNSAEKISGGRFFRCFQAASLDCLFFGRFPKSLKSLRRFLLIGQIPEKANEL